MSHAAQLPAWAAILVAAFLALGSGLTLLGCIGLLRLRSFYDRIHAPTLGASWGTAAIVMASMIFFTVLESRPVLHEILIGIFVTVTTPVTLMLLGRAALYRDRAENSPDVPPSNVLQSAPTGGGRTDPRERVL
ncbi:cation:proton antiporter [Mesorhizobium sp. L-8-10]|uniref:monovalent cation/H(+) antiporter subunit G n=1 Tax=unclassified Mesorhizobium TaxID=325217 RepID=UPI001928A824|nr:MULTISPECIES: monovalent cation/H(+) antiporter subunit G [unclassified Mesorhizobium]BCH20762.1 cation:proton antiporter [Mesorhizobium sp. L-8-3]BCH28606.1 cation:proton antiporter [Mesorhizobium sp. L-8-10]